MRPPRIAAVVACYSVLAFPALWVRVAVEELLI